MRSRARNEWSIKIVEISTVLMEYSELTMEHYTGSYAMLHYRPERDKMYGSRRSWYDLEKRTRRIKPTLYFTEKEIEQIEEFRYERNYSEGRSKAAYIEEATRAQIEKDQKLKKEKEEEAKKQKELEKAKNKKQKKKSKK